MPREPGDLPTVTRGYTHKQWLSGGIDRAIRRVMEKMQIQSLPELDFLAGRVGVSRGTNRVKIGLARCRNVGYPK